MKLNTIPETAERLGLKSRDAVYRLLRNGELGSVTVGRRRLVICINQERLKILPDLQADMATVVTDEFVDYMEGLCGTDD